MMYAMWDIFYVIAGCALLWFGIVGLDARWSRKYPEDWESMYSDVASTLDPELRSTIERYRDARRLDYPAGVQ